MKRARQQWVTGQRCALHTVSRRARRLLSIFLVAMCLSVTHLGAQPNSRPVLVAILDFADSGIGKLSSKKLAVLLASTTGLAVADQDLSRAAARGIGYSGSLNLSLSDARDLGSAIGCDFYFLGDAQTLRRSPSNGPVYFESYASIFLISARTGRLVSWTRPSFAAGTAEAAERLLIEELGKDELRTRYATSLQRTLEEERHEREATIEHNVPIIEPAVDEKASADESFRPPRPYRRLRPVYPDTAARADADGTVDVLVEIDKDGEVTHAEVARWAGFGLDEATLATVRQLHFFPATRDRVPVPIRILLRYNFRRPLEK
jgi:TonB family protein